MKSLSTLTLLALVGLAVPAFAETPANLAKMHLDAVGAGDVAKITSQYNASSSLAWVGGPLNGTFIGPQQLAEVWGKFAKAQAPLKVSVRDMKESGNPAGTTVTADVVFTGKNTLKIRYVMLYRGDNLVDEVFQIDPKMAE
jgi:hypothetical protein